VEVDVVVAVLVVLAVVVLAVLAVLVVLAGCGSVLAVTFETAPFFQASSSVESVSKDVTDSPEARAIIMACARG
jgi:uncharacterized protein YceK